MLKNLTREIQSWQKKAILFDFYQSGIGVYRQIFFGTPQSIFDEIVRDFPHYAKLLFDEHGASLKYDDSLSLYFEEERGLEEAEYADLDFDDVIKFLKQDMFEFRDKVQSFDNKRSILKDKWYEINFFFDNLPDGDHLYIEFEGTLPNFCKQLRDEELSRFSLYNNPNPDFSQLGQISYLASLDDNEWKRDEINKLFHNFVKFYNEKNNDFR